MLSYNGAVYSEYLWELGRWWPVLELPFSFNGNVYKHTLLWQMCAISFPFSHNGENNNMYKSNISL